MTYAPTRYLAAAALALIAAAPVAADPYCDDLWLTRNMIFDRAGYCFSSPLGQALFGANGCSTTDPVLDVEARRIVEEVRRIEAVDACKVDTSRTRLDVENVAARLALIDPPIRDFGESACFGWRGAPLILRSGRSDSAPQTGIIRTGDTILTGYQDVDGWSFIAEGGDGLGWVRMPPWTGDACDAFAG